VIVMRLSGVGLTGFVVGLLFGQQPTAIHHPFLWDRELSLRPNLYIPEAAVVDAGGVLWVLCSARMGNEGYDKQHVTQAIFRIDEQGNQLSTAELGLPLSQEERGDTSDYRITPLRDGGIGLAFNKIRFETRGQSYLGAFYSTLGTDGKAGPLRQVAGPEIEVSAFVGLANGDLLLGGGLGDLLTFDPNGVSRWKKSFVQPILENSDAAVLSDRNICISAWAATRQRLLNKIRVMRLGQQGDVLHTADIDALRGQVAAGPDGSCAVLYDRAPSIYKGEYYLTLFDRSFNRQWTVPVPHSSASGAEFDLISRAEGSLAQIGNVIVQYDWSGKEVWKDIEHLGQTRTIVAAGTDGFFIVTKDLGMNNGFHVKRAAATKE
jgi:hypothetical protein